MSSFDKYVRRVFFGTLSLILLFAGIFLFVERMPWARGVVLGGAASLVNLVIMAGDVRKQGVVIESKSFRSAYGRYALRMSLLAGVLIYSATNENIALWATIPALFASQFAMTCGELLAGREQGTT
ncbi:MAG: ATP synthase subunit I [bacterium]|nr:ATP synthase subunit I [bacterium]MDT8367363.1 ATP synthase subunit I [bacterium]